MNKSKYTPHKIEANWSKEKPRKFLIQDIKPKKAEWDGEVHTEAECSTGILKCVIFTLVGFIVLLMLLFPDQIISCFTK